MLLPNGLQYTRRWMIKIIGEDMVQGMFDFAQRFNALKLTHEEYALVFPIAICAQGSLTCLSRTHSGTNRSLDDALVDHKTVRNIKYCYLYALYMQMLTRRTHTEARALFRNLLEVSRSIHRVKYSIDSSRL